VGRRDYTEDAKHWKCAAPLNLEKVTKDIVTGSNVPHYKALNCYTARDLEEYCGRAGKWFAKYEHNPYVKGLNPGGRRPSPSADDLLKELED
jgi:hypothetical protein